MWKKIIYYFTVTVLYSSARLSTLNKHEIDFIVIQKTLPLDNKIKLEIVKIL